MEQDSESVIDDETDAADTPEPPNLLVSSLQPGTMVETHRAHPEVTTLWTQPEMQTAGGSNSVWNGYIDQPQVYGVREHQSSGAHLPQYSAPQTVLGMLNGGATEVSRSDYLSEIKARHEMQLRLSTAPAPCVSSTLVQHLNYARNGGCHLLRATMFIHFHFTL